jgi:hypothetical protein
MGIQGDQEVMSGLQMPKKDWFKKKREKEESRQRHPFARETQVHRPKKKYNRTDEKRNWKKLIEDI